MMHTFKSILTRGIQHKFSLHPRSSFAPLSNNTSPTNFTSTASANLRTDPHSIDTNPFANLSNGHNGQNINPTPQNHERFANQISQYSLTPNTSDSNTLKSILSKVEMFGTHTNTATDPNSEYLTPQQQHMLDTLVSDTYTNPEQIMNAFYMVDLGDIIRQHLQWTNLLPQIHPYYAIKCNPDPLILSLLNYLGCAFDCASKSEFNLLQSNGVNIGSEDKVIFSHPCKHPLHLQYAREIGVDLCTFDNEYEIEKIAQFHPQCKALLRIQVDDSQSICKFNSKYGYCVDSAQSVYDMFEKCRAYNINLNGVMFHVGSGCLDKNVYNTAIAKSKELFEIAHDRYGYDKGQMNVLDLGGGFPGDIVYQKNAIQFSEIAQVINDSLQYYFGEGCEGYRFIAEPGRYYVSKSHSLVCDIIAKKRNRNGFMYYINEGMYGSFNCMYFDHAEPVIIPYGGGGGGEGKKYESTIFGPTCDSMDKMYDGYLMREMSIMDKMVIPNFGAYTGAASSGFNGFERSKSRYVMTL